MLGKRIGRIAGYPIGGSVIQAPSVDIRLASPLDKKVPVTPAVVNPALEFAMIDKLIDRDFKTAETKATRPFRTRTAKKKTGTHVFVILPPGCGRVPLMSKLRLEIVQGSELHNSLRRLINEKAGYYRVASARLLFEQDPLLGDGITQGRWYAKLVITY